MITRRGHDQMTSVPCFLRSQFTSPFDFHTVFSVLDREVEYLSMGKDAPQKVHETRSHTRASGDEEGKSSKGKQKADEEIKDSQHQSKNKKAKVEEGEKSDNSENGGKNEKPSTTAAIQFDKFCNLMRAHLSVEEMRRMLEANLQDPSGSDDAIVPRCQDVMFFGPLEECPYCGGQVEVEVSNYACRGFYSEWSSCVYTTLEPKRREEPLKLPEGVGDDIIREMVKNQMEGRYPQRQYISSDKPLSGMTIALSGRLSRRHQEWREEVEKHGGIVSGNAIGVKCIVVSPAERDRGGSSKIAEATERGVPVVSEAWLADSIKKKERLPLKAYDVLSDLIPEGRGIPLDKQDPIEEAFETLTAELKLYSKRGVHKDSRLQEQGGSILDRDGILYNCALSICDKDKGLGWGINEYCVIQLITIPEKNLHLYFKRCGVGDEVRAEEQVEEWNSVDEAVKEFVGLFEKLTGNEFEKWEREKQFQKKSLKFYPIDMDVGVDVRHGGLGLRQLGVAATHSKLEPRVANLMKVLCSQEIYRYALVEMGYDSPELPMGMLSDNHLNKCKEDLIKTTENLRSQFESDTKRRLQWLDFSNRWFTQMPTTRPFLLRNFQELADHVAAAYESIRDINVASRLIEDMTGATIDDPLSDRYNKLNCTISPVDKESADYKMVVKYLETTYEPIKVEDVSYGVSVENIFAVESRAGPSYEDIKKLPNKILLWSGTRSSNLLRHMHKGLLPAVCQIRVPGYMFGKAIVCSDASAEAARYGFTAVDRPEGFLILGIVALGEQIVEMSKVPDDTKEWEEKKLGVKGLGKKQTEQSEHFTWKDDIKVPCGRLVPSEHGDSPLEYTEYAVYDSKQVMMKFLVAVKYEEQNMEIDSEEE